MSDWTEEAENKDGQEGVAVMLVSNNFIAAFKRICRPTKSGGAHQLIHGLNTTAPYSGKSARSPGLMSF